MPNADPSSMLQRVAAGDVSAVQECLDSYGGQVWSLARRLSPRKEDAEEAVQEIFQTLWRYADRYVPEQMAESVFVTMIARRRLIDRLGARAARGAGGELPDRLQQIADRTAVDPDRAARRSAEAGRAARALQTLSGDQQAMLKLAVLLGLGHDDLAQAFGRSPDAIKTQLRHGLLSVCQQMTPADL